MKQELDTKTPELPVDRRQEPAALPAVRRGEAPEQVVSQRSTAAQPTTPMDLLRIATERGATMEEMAKLMDLLERQQDREARQAFVRAMAEFKKSAPRIVKDAGASFQAKGQQVEYGYATLGHICEQVIAALAEHGIAHDWAIQQPSNGMILVTCTLTHEQGSSKSATIEFPPDPSGTKNGLQAIGSAVTYGQRYTLLAVCGIAVKEQGDDDANGAASKDATLADYWAMKAGGATTQEALHQVWTDGIAKISEKGDKAAYATFKAAVSARKKELAGAA
jgi:hypothetical protein